MGSTRGISVTILIAATVLLIATGQAGASVVLVNTFGPGDFYSIGSGGTLGSSYPGSNAGAADRFSFTGSESYQLDSIELAVGLLGGTNQLTLSLMTDAAGVPGAALESFSFTGQMGPFGSYNPPMVGTSVTHPTLTPGTNYWLVASVPDLTSAAWNKVYWDKSTPPIIGTRAYNDNGGPWHVEEDFLDVFRVNGTVAVIPAPGTLLLGLLGLGCLRGVLRRRLP
jgi:hypothetical protein